MTSDSVDMAQDQLATQAAAEIIRRRVEVTEQPERTGHKRDGEKRKRKKPETPRPTGQDHTIDLVA